MAAFTAAGYFVAYVAPSPLLVTTTVLPQFQHADGITSRAQFDPEACMATPDIIGGF